MRNYRLLRFLLISGYLLWTSADLLAGDATVGVEVRSDLQWRSSAPEKKEPVSGQVDSNYTEFVMQRAALDFQGALDAGTSYRLRLAFQDWLNSSESTPSDGIEYAYIRHSLQEGLSLKMGQFFMATGAWENDYNEMDQYLYSRTNSHFPMLYGTGLDLRVLVDQQTFVIQAVNSPFREPDQQETAFAGTAAWYGNFYDGFLQTLLTYGSFQSPVHTSHIIVGSYPSLEEDFTVEKAFQEAFTVSQSGIGIRWNTIKLQFEAEYNRVLWPEYKRDQWKEDTIVPVTQDDQLFSGIVVFARYRSPEPWHILLKYTFDQEKTANQLKFQQEGWAAGVEKYQENSDKYRAHLMLIRTIEKPESASLWTHTQVNIGASLKWP